MILYLRNRNSHTESLHKDAQSHLLILSLISILKNNRGKAAWTLKDYNILVLVRIIVKKRIESAEEIHDYFECNLLIIMLSGSLKST